MINSGDNYPDIEVISPVDTIVSRSDLKDEVKSWKTDTHEKIHGQ